MKKKTIFLLVSIVFFVTALLAMMKGTATSHAIEGAAKGLAGVFFILFFIFTLLEKQPEDKSSH